MSTTPRNDVTPAVAESLADALAPAVPRSVLRMACATADVDERTAARFLLGMPVRDGNRERLLAALTSLGVDVGSLPQVHTGRVDGAATRGASAPLTSGKERDS
jgi:hypothetical protein